MQPTETRRTPCAVSVDLLGYIVLWLIVRVWWRVAKKREKKAVERTTPYFL